VSELGIEIVGWKFVNESCSDSEKGPLIISNERPLIVWATGFEPATS
jgi:hypothetical protein